MALTNAEKSARYRAKDIEAYRSKKNALIKTPHHRAVRAEYARKWRAAHKKPSQRKKVTADKTRERKRAYAKKWRESNRDKHNENSRKSYHKYKDRYKAKIRDYVLRKKYGIGSDDVERMLVTQGSRCKICADTASHGRNWHVDHCHKTGRVRGILCHVCNTKLGWFERFKDRIEDYLT